MDSNIKAKHGGTKFNDAKISVKLSDEHKNKNTKRTKDFNTSSDCITTMTLDDDRMAKICHDLWLIGDYYEHFN